MGASVTADEPAAAAPWGAGLSFEDARDWARVVRPAHRQMTAVLLDGAGLAPGLSVLDLACGQGIPALDEARRVAPGGTVVGADISEPSITLARRFAEVEKVANASFQLADAEALPFESGRFDRVTSRFGPMFFPHLDRALAEAKRVLRPGGRIAWLVWDVYEDQPLFLSTVGAAARQAGLASPPPEALQPFRFGDGHGLRAAIDVAGFRYVEETRHRVIQEWEITPEELAASMLRKPAPPFQGIVHRLSPASLDAAIAEAARALRPLYSNGAVRVPATVILVKGTRPE